MTNTRVTLLASSILLNAVMAWVIFARPDSRTISRIPSLLPQSHSPIVNTVNVMTDGISVKRRIWNLTDPLQVAEKMRTDGYPDALIRVAVRVAAESPYLQQNTELMEQFFWPRMRPWRQAITLPSEISAKVRENAGQRVRAAEWALEQAGMDDPVFWSPTPGLTTIKGMISQNDYTLAKRLEREYAEKIGASRETFGTLSVADAEKEALLNAQLQRELQGILGPEYANYQYYNSEAARATMSLVGDPSRVDPSVFKTMVEVVEQYQARANDSDNDKSRVASSVMFVKELRKAIGDERMASILPRIDQDAASVEGLLTAAPISVRLDMFEIAFAAAIHVRTQSADASSAARHAEDRILALLDESDAQKYRESRLAALLKSLK